jgi:hypothetical protein
MIQGRLWPSATLSFHRRSPVTALAAQSRNDAMAQRRRQPENPHGRMKTCRTARNVPCFRHKNRATIFLRVTAKKIQSAEQALFINHLKKRKNSYAAPIVET